MNLARGAGRFRTTRWTLVIDSAGHSPAAKAALSLVRARTRPSAPSSAINEHDVRPSTGDWLTVTRTWMTSARAAPGENTVLRWSRSCSATLWRQTKQLGLTACGHFGCPLGQYNIVEPLGPTSGLVASV